MPEHYVANVNVSVEDDTVILDSLDPRLELMDQTTPSWRLDLDSEVPDHAVFAVHPVGGSARVIQVRSRPSGGEWSDWSEQDGAWHSQPFDDGDAFTLEVQVSESGAIRHGSSHFHVRDTGGGDDVT